MHLSHEKKWIYGSLMLTVAFFIVLMFVPIFTTMDTIGTPTHVRTPRRRDGALTMGLRAFHLLFIALSVVLAAFVAAWAGGPVPARARGDLRGLGQRRCRRGRGARRVRRRASSGRRGICRCDDPLCHRAPSLTPRLALACPGLFRAERFAAGEGHQHGHPRDARGRGRRARELCRLFHLPQSARASVAAATDTGERTETAQC